LRTWLVSGRLLARCLGIAWFGLLPASPGAQAAPVRLENDHVAVEVDAATGGLLSLRDKGLQAYRMSGLGFRLETDRGTVDGSQLRLERHPPAALTLRTDAAGFAVSLHYAAVFGETEADFEFGLLTSISASSYCQMGGGFAGLARESNRKFLAKWRAWATENYAFLKVKRDLFDCPGYTRIDGSAHILKDRGFLFLFPGGFHSNDYDRREEGKNLAASVRSLPRTARAAVPLQRWIGLEENPSAFCQLVELYPQAGRSLGVFRYGEELQYDMPRESAVVLALEPATAGVHPPRIGAGAPAETVEVVPAFSSTPPSVRAAASGPSALPLHLPLDEPDLAPASAPETAQKHPPVNVGRASLAAAALGRSLRLDDVRVCRGALKEEQALGLSSRRAR
jgi:hypothetical protein